MLKSIDEFLDSALVTWAKSILNPPAQTLNYARFTNGEYFYEILKQSDPCFQYLCLPNEGSLAYETTRSRLLNLDFTLRKIKHFYQAALNHVLLTKLPDVYHIAKYPDSEDTFQYMETMLLLLLGIAINGDYKQTFIEQIQQNLDTQTQLSLIPKINTVNDDINFSISKNLMLVLDPDVCVTKQTSVKTSIVIETGVSVSACSSTESFVQNCAKISEQVSTNTTSLKYTNLQELNYFLNGKLMPNLLRIVEDRDSYQEIITELQLDKDYLNCMLNNPSIGSSNSNSNEADGLNKNGDCVTGLSSSCSFDLISNSKSSLVNLSDTQTLLMIFESVYKEISSSQNVDSKLSNCEDENMGEGVKINCDVNEAGVSREMMSENEMLVGKNTNDNFSMFLNELKNKKCLSNNWNQKIAIELVECKIKLKQLINEIEEKCEQIESFKDEIDQVKKQINKLRNENVDLQQKAALANVYSDELESLREKSLKADKYESEIIKLKERIEELHASKSRLEDLKEENLILTETRTIMEKQINDYQVRLLGVQRLDSDLNKYKLDIEDLLNQRELDKKRLCDLCEKNAKLELDMKNVLNQNVNLDKELNSYKQELTFLSAELAKQKHSYETNQQALHSQTTQTIETSRLKQAELERLNTELSHQLKSRDQDLSRFKENLRSKEINLEECLVKLRVLNDELNSEHESRVKSEKNLEKHKLEIRDLQVRLDDCVSETKKLDVTIRAAAHTNEQKDSETKDNLRKLIDSHEQLNHSYKKLLADHEQLQKIYLQLESDYEELYSELSKKHSKMSGLQFDFDDLKEKHALCKGLEAKMNRILVDKCVNTEGLDLNKLEETKSKCEFYESKFEEMNKEIFDLKSVERKLIDLSKQLDVTTEENLSLKSKCTHLKLEFEKQKDKEKLESVQIGQLNEKLVTYESLNEKLEDEKSQLFEQLHLLLQQNQEILIQTLNSKDMYHEETKSYLQQLNNLKRQKEMLEQKIMEQYKSCPSLSQKQKNKKSLTGSNNTSTSSSSAGLMDMFSKTRQFVQKVRNKSNTSQQAIETSPNLILNVNDLSEECEPITNTPGRTSYCHKYSADDINYLNIKTKDQSNQSQSKSASKSNINLVNCLSSSSSTSSSSASSTISNYDSNKLQAEPKTPVKLDPKSLKLGGRPQSICSSVSSSPIPHSQSVVTSPNVVTIKPPAHLSDFKRVLITSSPRFNNSNGNNQVQSFINQSPSSSSTSSCSSSTSSSSGSVAPKTSVLSAQMPTKSPIAMITKKSNSIQLIATSSLNGQRNLVQAGKNRKITSKIADSLNKFRLSTELDQIETCQIGNDDDEDDDDEDDQDDFSESDEEFNSLKKEKSVLKGNKLNTSLGQSNGNKNSNEIWLEYGCI